MFNPEKLLGGLLRGGSRRGGSLSGLVTGGAAMGVLGVAMEAVEHFMNKPKSASAGSGAAVPPAGPYSAPMPGPAPMGSGASMPPPPPSGGAMPASPPPMPMTPAPAAVTQSGDAVLLIRAMIAAANADGVIDQEERNRILEKLKSLTLSREEHGFIVQELLAPKELDTIVEQVHTPELARQVYAVSLLAIEVDTDAERDYMSRLAERLGLDTAAVEEVHKELEIDLF